MPRVKVDYIVSFSSEDPENPASNLLASEVSKKKWLCKTGEPSCSVVLQLTRAVKISTVHIGAYHAAFVEVLVGRSETPNEEFQVLVPTSVFLSPGASRQAGGAAVERVRSFGAELLAPARAQRWDRVRLVCTQPHNAHCKYGLSFVHIYEPESAVPPRLLSLDNLSSDDDEFKPGELFAKHSQKPTLDTSSNTSTGAQIRQATSQALKNIQDSSTKLVKTGIANTIGKRQSVDPQDEVAAHRGRDALLYTSEDSRPHARADSLLQRRRDEVHDQTRSGKKEKTYNPVNSKRDEKKDNETSNKTVDHQISDKRDSKKYKDSGFAKASHSKEHISHSNTDEDTTIATHSSRNSDDSGCEGRDVSDRKKRRRTDGEHKEKGGASALGAVLRGAVLVLSGYENPRRAAVRAAALALGARVERHWGPRCTHLICAFPNTPKLRQVRAGAGGPAVPVARAAWLRHCRRARRRLPWQWFATEPQHRRPPDPPYHYDSDDDVAPDSEPDCDTDEEIEKVLRDQKKPKTAKSPRSPGDRPLGSSNHGRIDSENREHKSSDSEKLEGLQSITRSSPVTLNGYSETVVVADAYDAATDEDDLATGEAPRSRLDCTLPNFFDGYTFLIDEAIDPRFDVQMLTRYIRAYGGIILEATQLDETSEVSYTLCSSINSSSSNSSRARGVRVAPHWVWRCHAAGTLLPAH